MDSALPAHRVAFASKLRDLRRECGQPTYRAMGELAHCSFTSLSAAAAGRRLPTWETTRGYVTACLSHAGRAPEIASALVRWRRRWEDASVLEKAHRVAPPADPPPPVAATARRWVWRPAWLTVVVVLLLATVSGAGPRPPAPAPMTGLFNILVLPSPGLPSLTTTLARELAQWARDEPIIEVRGPSGVGRPLDAARAGAEHNADVVLEGRLATSGDRWTVTIVVELTERLFSQTPEIVGRHEISLTEPADVIRGNLEVNRQLAEDAVRQVQAVVAFVHGLGRYALDDYPGAERDFRTAERGLSAGTNTIRAEAVLLMLGNAVGRATRYAEAAEIYRRALRQSPGYARASLGLAEAVRAGSPNSPAGLRQALGLYRGALAQREDPLVEMKTRLGLGLAYQSLSLIDGGDHWAAADTEYAAVVRVQAAAGLRGEAGRQAIRLAAEAHAGLALTAWRSGRNADAAAGYEAALGVLGRIGVERPTIRDRELIFLRNLRDVYTEMGATPQAEDVAARIRRAGGEA